MVIVRWLLRSLRSQDVVREKSPEQHDVDDPHDGDGRRQHRVVERRHVVPVRVQCVTDERHAEHKAAHNERAEVHQTDDSVDGMREPNVHYLHQFPQVKEDAVDLDY